MLSLLGFRFLVFLANRGLSDERYFAVLIALGLMQPAPADDRREINSQYVVDDMAVAKRKLADAFLKRSDPLWLALGGNEIMKAEDEAEAELD